MRHLSVFGAPASTSGWNRVAAKRFAFCKDVRYSNPVTVLARTVMSPTRSHPLLAVLIDTALDCVICTDRTGQVIEFNPAAEATFGWRRAEALGQRVFDLIVPPVMRDLHGLLLAGYRPGQPSKVVGHRQELPVVRRDGTQFTAEFVLTTTELEGELVFVAQLRDITERLRHERELRAARDNAEAADRAKSAFVAAMSHEVRTPLAAISGSLQLLAEMSLDREEQRLVRIARQSSEVLTNLVDDVLDFARIEAGELEVENIDFAPERLLDGVVHLLAPRVRQQRVALLTELDPELPRVVCMGRDRVRQLLVNLGSNAVRFSPGGEVSLRLRQGLPGHLRLEVQDDGPGIPRERQALLFEQTSSREFVRPPAAGGAGLGLAMCKRLVGLLGGRIGVISVPGQGSTFWAELPWQSATETVDDAVLPSGKRILVLTEEHSGRQLERQYSLWGMTVERVPHADAAIGALEAGVGVPYDLAILDLRPGSVAGGVPPALLQRCRAAGVPVAALQEAVGAAITVPRDQGADYLLSVPLLLGELRQCLRPPVSAVPAATVVPAAGRRLRVLLADDSQSNRLVLTELLRRRGCEVDVATNGLEAVESVQRSIHDVVLMDIDMPVMDGVAALQALRRLGGRIARLPVVAMTAHAAQGARAEFLAAGFDDYLAKPVDGNALMATVARCAPGHAAQVAASAAVPAAPAEAGAWLAQHFPDTTLDTGALRRLAQEVGEERLPRMVRIFCEELERRTALVGEALGREDLSVLARESHVLKGSAATFGAHELQRHAARLNDACRQEARREALESGGLLLAAVPRTLQALRAAVPGGNA